MCRGAHMTFVLCFIFLGIPAVHLLHEIGHLIAARWYGVRVLRLSVGLGPELLGYTDQKGTRWALAVLPLGGSLAMCDRRNSNATPAEAFSNKTLGQRAVICGAGPLASLLLAAAIYGLSVAIFGEVALPGTETDHVEVAFVGFIGAFSFVVALFSLIPIPPLDGGRLALYGMEAFTRKPISQSLEKTTDTLGMATIAISSITILVLAML